MHVEDALYFSRYQTSLIIIGIPFLIYTFGKLANFKRINLLTLLVILMSLCLVAINHISEFPIKYYGQVALVQADFLFGESFYVLTQKGSVSSFYFHFISSAFMFPVLYFSFIFFREKRTFFSVVLSCYPILQITTTVISYYMDLGGIQIFNIGGLPLTLVSLVCALLIGTSLKSYTALLQESTARKVELEEAIEKIATGVSSHDEEDFFVDVSRLIHDFSRCKWVILGLYEKNGVSLKTKVVLKDGIPGVNFNYPLNGSPCAYNKQTEVQVYQSGVRNDFPEDLFLQKELIESFVSVPLASRKGSPVGLFVLLDEAPYYPSDEMMHVMDVFASRTLSEIRRFEAESKLFSMAYYDYVSKLPSRPSMLQELNKIYFEREADGGTALMLILDIDYFGQINRKYGNDVADEIIRIIAQRLQHLGGEDAFVARNTGDEFVLIYRNIKGEVRSYLDVYWTAIQAVISRVCEVQRHQISLTVSMGAVCFPQQIDNRFDVIGAAEQALRVAKDEGRNRCSLYNPALMEILDEKRIIQEDLVLAISDTNQIYTVYQPKVSFEGCVVGAEALVRWKHPTKGFITPSEFIPIAEESGLVRELGYKVTELVINSINVWRNKGVEVPTISINLAAAQLNDDGFVLYLEEMLKEHSLQHNSIELELTESSLLINEDKAIGNMRKLRDLGVSISLDDFGTGYSSLGYLQKLPLDILKIDKSFIDNIHEPKSEELIRAIINIAKAMSLKTVAEGVEVKSQVDHLHEIGCDFYQGYYFSQPITDVEFVELLSSNEEVMLPS